MSIEFILELILLVFLLISCGFAFFLNRKLITIRAGQEELVEKLSQFDKAAYLAQENLATISTRSVSLDRDLSARLQEAHALCDELSVMVHSGGNVAQRIEGAVTKIKSMGPSSHNPASHTPSPIQNSNLESVDHALS